MEANGTSNAACTLARFGISRRTSKMKYANRRFIPILALASEHLFLLYRLQLRSLPRTTITCRQRW